MEVGGKYRLGDRIGGGGMAEVFEATLVGAEGFSRPVAIKRMLPSLSADPAFGAMFVNEARLASLLHHPSIGSTLDFDRDEEGRYFLVMELIRGIDLRQLAQSGPLPVDVSIHIAAELLRGLDYAHELVHDGRHLRIVHRDVSPHNVMVSFSGGVKLVDFGIAKAVAATGASRSGSLKGKVAYMSPEQAHGHDIDGRADVFAVGVILHELLTGQRLFAGATEPETLARLLTQPIPRPSEVIAGIPADVDAAVMSMLARDPAQRASSAHVALEQLLGCGAVSPRSGLALRDLLASRFPGQAPVRGASGAHSGIGASVATPPSLAPSVAPVAALSAAVASPRPRGRSQLWLLIVAAVVSAIGIASALVIRAGRDGSKVAEAADASPPSSVLDASMSVPDAAAPTSDAAIAARTPDAAPPDTTTANDASKKSERESKKERREREKKERERQANRDKNDSPDTTSDKAEMGEVVFTADPWAIVTVAGKRLGRTPQRTKLPVGSYRARFANPDLGKSSVRSFTIKRGRTATVKARWE